jgi:diguanylate cyclase (GGDEF)-like protein/PAS domain S-box-containing protein/putative nucleotidyltransferase with HDIG domain
MGKTAGATGASGVRRQAGREIDDVMAFAVMHALSMVVITDARGAIEYVNKKFCEVTGYAADEVIGQPTSLLKSGLTPRATYQALWRHLKQGEGWTGEFVNRTRRGRAFWELAYISAVQDAAGRIHHYLKIAVDITARKRLEARLRKSLAALRTREGELQGACRELRQTAQALERSRRRLQRLAQQDMLTGLLNRRGLHEALRRTRALAARQGRGTGLLVIDIDRFKRINDDHGHAAGDRILKTLAARLRACLRAADLVCRYGGDEIVVALPDADAAATRQAAQRILDTVRAAEPRHRGRGLAFTVSIGAACLPPGSSSTLEQVLAQADQALFRVKRAGRNGLAFWPARDEPAAALDDRLRSRPCSEVFDMLLAMLDARERATGEHSRRVAKVAAVLAEALALPPEQVETVAQGALLHDIGKIAIPESILLKPGPLTARERLIVRRHPRAGYDILKANPEFKSIAEIVLSHQERFDGTGYPRGLKGRQICPGARIFAAADAYDAIRAGRSYAPARSAAEALAEIRRCRGTQFDPAVVDGLVRAQARIEALLGASFAKRPSARRRQGSSTVKTEPRG